MKKYLLIPIFMTTLPLIINACSYGSSVNKTVFILGYDFRPYTEKGFLFTPEQYLGDYNSIGFISVEIIPTVYQIPYGTETKKKDWETLAGKTRYWEAELISPKEVLDTLYNKAVRMGADAVVRFSLTTTSHYNGDADFYGLEASGFAIKRR